MEMAELAQTQKRIYDWEKFVEKRVYDPDLKRSFAEKLKALRHLLARAFENGALTNEDHEQLKNIEHQLTQLHEKARVTVVPRIQRTTSA